MYLFRLILKIFRSIIFTKAVYEHEQTLCTMTTLLIYSKMFSLKCLVNNELIKQSEAKYYERQMNELFKFGTVLQ